MLLSWPTASALLSLPEKGQAMTDTVSDERDAFEAWYCADAAKSGLELWPADIAAMRDGDEYGSQRVALNSKWEGWQGRAMLAASPQGKGSPIGQNDQPGLAFSDAGEP